MPAGENMLLGEFNFDDGGFVGSEKDFNVQSRLGL